MKRYIFLFSILLFLSANGRGQAIRKLAPDGNTIKIIGTRFSVNYDNNQSSETVNTKSHVFDGDFNTFFASYDRSNTWVGLDLGEKHVLTQLAYCPRQNHEKRLELGVFEGANTPDFGDAVLLGIITNQPPFNRLTEQAVVNSRGFRYVRYVGPNDVRCNIAEIAFYGYPAEGNDSQLSQTTNIPDVIIHTVNGADITSKTEYIKGIISFISNEGKTIHTDSLEIRGRGNASWGFEKKPYRIKLFQKAKVLGHAAEARNWTLISNHGDKTLMRNLLAFDFSRRLEMPYTPAGRPVNLFLNGEYKGCYQLCDHIDVRKTRVNIKEMKPSDVSGENLTGGYLIEIDAYADQEAVWFTSQRNHIPVTIKSPDSDEIAAQQRTYIQNHFNAWENAVFASNYTHPENGFRKYMDTPTFVRHFLTGEFSGNTDTYWSVYLYKQRNDDRFYIGPVWDFDLAYDNDSRTYPVNQKNRTGWLYRSGGSGANGVTDVINRLLSDAALYNEIRDTYSYYRDRGIISKEALLKVVDDYVQEINPSQELNFKRWDIINAWVHMINHNTGSYQGEVAIVKKYIEERIDWMDEKLNYIPHPVEPVPVAAPESPFVNVWVDKNTIHINGGKETIGIEISNVSGQIVYKNQVTAATGIPLEAGIYIVRLSCSGKGSKTYKLSVATFLR
jgi:hypothetical protein